MHAYPEYIKNNIDFFKNIAKTKSTKRLTNLIREASDDQLLALVDICYNIIKGQLQLKKKNRTKLAENADYYRAIARWRTPKTARTRIQKGGAIGALGAIVAPILGVLAQNLLDKVLHNKKDDDEAR